MSKGLDPDQDRRLVGPDLSLNCVQRCQQLTKVATIKERAQDLFKFESKQCHLIGGKIWFPASDVISFSHHLNVICSLICFCFLVPYIINNMDPDQIAPRELSNQGS